MVPFDVFCYPSFLSESTGSLGMVHEQARDIFVKSVLDEHLDIENENKSY
jgi:hypothetical protein